MDMDSHELVRALIADSGKSMRAVSLDMGRSETWLSSTMHQGGSLKASTLTEIANHLGFRVVVTDGAHEYELPLVDMHFRAYVNMR